MLRNNINFKNRFYRQIDRDQVYENGPSLPGYKDGLEPDYSDTLNFLKKYEGFRDTVYLDGNGIPTIGYGFTDPELVNKGYISRADADKRLMQEVNKRESFLSRKMKNWDKLSSKSRTALLSYYFNYPSGFKDTTKFMQYWNNGDYDSAIKEVDAGMNDKRNPGLRPRRLAEQGLLREDPFLIGVDYSQPQIQKMINSTPKFNPVTVKPIPNIIYPLNPSDRTGYSIDSWKSADSPSAGLRMPSLQQYLNEMLENTWQGYADGKSPIHIKPANRGKLTRLKKRTGKSESELYNDGNPAHKKMVVFARNARKWKH